jgi:hypothetical protein
MLQRRLSPNSPDAALDSMRVLTDYRFSVCAAQRRYPPRPEESPMPEEEFSKRHLAAAQPAVVVLIRLEGTVGNGSPDRPSAGTQQRLRVLIVSTPAESVLAVMARSLLASERQ